jgi:release factor glutamine methyltransferase
VRVSEALAAAAQRLASASESPRLDAELLMAHALGVEREVMLLRRMDSETPPAFEALLARRAAGKPVAYITGRRAFWTIELEVGPGVLIPRPDSETLIEAAVDHFRGRSPATILDLGTGPGTLLLAALDQWPDVRGLGIDKSEKALGYARRNAERLGLDDYRRLALEIGRLLGASGVACIEIGATQEAAASVIFRAANLGVRTRNDLAGRPRCLVLSH